MSLRYVVRITLLPCMLVSSAFGNTTESASKQHPTCPGESYFTTQSSNGTRYGWFENATCIIESGATSSSNTSSSNTSSGNTSACIDSDNDGWGWNGVASCRITSGEQTTAQVTVSTNSGSGVPENCQKLDSGDYRMTDLVTDVFLTAGQSNAAGGETRYEPDRFSQDRVNSRVLVWTQRNTWEVADPRTQTWHNGKYPGGQNYFYNHPAFQIGRAIADRDACRVVAFIPTAAPGAQIDRWLFDQGGQFSNIRNTVNRAINALPARHQVDMIWWMQGESDNDPVVSRYFDQLKNLITKFRNETWFPHDGYFLANETGWSIYANKAIRMLGNDNNEYTDYSRGADSPSDRFPYLASDVVPTHFNEIALRKIGDLVANKYLYTYLNRR